jgi:hypothetical protein
MLRRTRLWILWIYVAVWLYFSFQPMSVAQDTAPLSPTNGPIIGGAATVPPTLAVTPAPVIRDGAIGPDAYAPNINPLTGLLVADAGALDRRPIIVKISNSPAIVRPQAGLSAADWVFEHYTELGVTRFSGVFYGNAPQRVGSIRSARLIDYELVPMYQGILAFAGGSIGVEKRIYGSEAVKAILCASRDDKDQCSAEADIIAPAGLIPPSDFADRAYKGVFWGPPYYYRDEAIAVPNNLFVNLEALWQRAAQDGFAQRPDLRGMAFHLVPPEAPAGAGMALEVRYRTTLVNWQYDSGTGQYYRISDNQPHFDANTQTQVSAANVLVVYAGHSLTDIVESGSGDNIHWSAEIALAPEGDVILFRDGLRYEGRWRRSTRPELMTFWTPDGNLLYLKPGNTWVQVMPLPDQLDATIEWVKFF